jgi:hypothetical protein
MGTPGFERWLWIELIGFDHTAPDLGVGALLETAGFVPDAVSLLLFNPDFVHLHAGLEMARPLPYDCCSYGGHSANSERQRQAWTTTQLRDLVAQLHGHGIAVYPAVFDMFVTDEWLGQHPELLHVRQDGQRLRSLCPWKRLADGSFYEDFFTAQLLRVMSDYGFDGLHGADGYAHPRIAIYDGDFSDDMVGQFVDTSGIVLPPDHPAAGDGTPAAIQARATWIWRHHRRAWSRFYADRITRFWTGVTAALHSAGKRVVINSTWTRDPFEATYRYGVDYRAMAAAGIDGLVVEAAACASETERTCSDAGVLHDFAAMLMLINACVPSLPLILLHGVKDTEEQWNVLRHTPPALEREVYALTNVHRVGPHGALHRCAAGLMVCLADDIRQEEWRWLRALWASATQPRPARILGATVVWSSRALEAQWDDFVANRTWTPHRIVHRLAAAGAPVHTVVRVEDLGATTGPLLVPLPHLLPPAEQAAVLNYRGGPVILVGPSAAGLPAPSFTCCDGEGPQAMVCAVYGAAGCGELQGLGAPRPAGAGGFDPNAAVEPGSFLVDLPFRPVSEHFLKAVAGLLIELGGGGRAVDGADRVRVVTLAEDDRHWVLLIANDQHGYARTRIEVSCRIAAIRTLTPFPPLPIRPLDTAFAVRVPGRGVVAVELTF